MEQKRSALLESSLNCGNILTHFWVYRYGYTILDGVAPSSNSSPRPIFLPLASNAIDAAANAAPALAPRLIDPFLNPTTAPAANPPSAPFHASFAFRALSLAHAVVANAHPIAPNNAAPLPTAPIVLASAGALLARTIAGASAPPSAARAHPTTAPNADDVIVAVIARSKHDPCASSFVDITATSSVRPSVRPSVLHPIGIDSMCSIAARRRCDVESNARPTALDLTHRSVGFLRCGVFRERATSPIGRFHASRVRLIDGSIRGFTTSRDRWNRES